MNPVALITGASRGIGRGIALELAALGWNLVLNYVSQEEAARETAAAALARARSAAHVIRIHPVQADISVAADRFRLLEEARRVLGRLDMLVNNAGVAPRVRADVLETTEESLDRLLAINAKGPFFLTQLAARWMMEQVSRVDRPSTEPRPKIVTISSISAYAASVHRADYCLSKAALSMLTPIFAARLAEHGINVYEIRPGIIATDMTGPVKERYDALIAGGLTPLARWGTPEDVGRAVAAIAQDLLPFSTGEVLNVDGGFHLRRL